MRTFQDCMEEVARKHGLGKKLVIGHRVHFFEEAAELYKNSCLEEEAVNFADWNNTYEDTENLGYKDKLRERYKTKFKKHGDV